MNDRIIFITSFDFDFLKDLLSVGRKCKVIWVERPHFCFRQLVIVEVNKKVPN